MKLSLLVSVCVLGAIACGKPEPKTATAETTAAELAAPEGHDEAGRSKTSTDKADLGKPESSQGAKADAKPGDAKPTSGDPLAVDASLEAGAVPTIEHTPAKQLRAKTRGMLEAAMKAAQSAKDVDGAVKMITARVGKPTWTEKGQRRVWVSAEKTQCHRLVLETDGSLELETQPVSEWKMLSALTKQNACTGEIRRGIDSVK
jgi:hypothetical protein